MASINETQAITSLKKIIAYITYIHTHRLSLINTTTHTLEIIGYNTYNTNRQLKTKSLAMEQTNNNYRTKQGDFCQFGQAS